MGENLLVRVSAGVYHMRARAGRSHDRAMQILGYCLRAPFMDGRQGTGFRRGMMCMHGALALSLNQSGLFPITGSVKTCL